LGRREKKLDIHEKLKPTRNRSIEIKG